MAADIKHEFKTDGGEWADALIAKELDANNVELWWIDQSTGALHGKITASRGEDPGQFRDK